MKTPDDSDDEGAEGDGDDEDFDGRFHQILAISPRLNKCDRTQIMTTTLVQIWISRWMDIWALQILMLVCLTASSQKPRSGGARTDQLSRYILFKGQTRGGHRSGGRPRNCRHTWSRWTREINDPIPMDEGVSRGRRTRLPLLAVQ